MINNMTPLKSQIFGLSLAVMTALVCIAYEKLVLSLSINFYILIKIIELIFAMIFVYIIFKDYSLRQDFNILINSKSLLFWFIIDIILSVLITIIWFVITKSQGIMVSSIYEVKYIVMLAIIYYLIGDKPFSLDMLLGVCLAILSIYFISRS